jgi:FKBP-type peptidyl-prolyl cis-trans isomerase SlpA
MRPEPGQIIGFTDENGEELPGAVLEVAAEQVKVDFNHPLAGREIIFDVHILAVENPMEQEG